MKTFHIVTALVFAALIFGGCEKSAVIEELMDSKYITTYSPVSVSNDLLRVSAAISDNPPGLITEYGFLYEGDGAAPLLSTGKKIIAGNSSPGSAKFTANIDVSVPDLDYAIRAYVIIDGQTFYGQTNRYQSLPRGIWQKAADFPGAARSFPYYFSANGKGYVGCGWSGVSALKDFWEFDPVTGQWTQLQDFPGSGRAAGFSFVIGNKAYMGGGVFSNPMQAASVFYNDFYSFDATTKTWTRLNNFPTVQAVGAEGFYGTYHFSAGGYGFVGGGKVSYQNPGYGINRYDPTTDTWAPYGLNPADQNNQIYEMGFPAWFVLQDTLFVGTGLSDNWRIIPTDNFFRYEYKSNKWAAIGPIPGGARAYNAGFENSGFGYIAFDLEGPDMWQYQYSTTEPFFKATSRSPDSYFNQGGVVFTIGKNTYMGLGIAGTKYLNPNAIYLFTPTR